MLLINRIFYDFNDFNPLDVSEIFSFKANKSTNIYFFINFFFYLCVFNFKER